MPSRYLGPVPIAEFVIWLTCTCSSHRVLSMPPFVPKLCGEHLSGAIRMNFKVVEMVLKSKKSSEATASEHQAAAIGS